VKFLLLFQFDYIQVDKAAIHQVKMNCIGYLKNQSHSIGLSGGGGGSILEKYCIRKTKEI